MISRRCSSLWEELIEKEESTVLPKRGGSLRAAVLFPAHYSVAIANLGFQQVYRIVAEHPKWIADRFFLPPRELRLGLKEEVPSFEEHLPLAQFQLVAASVSFENDLLNLITLLEQAGIPAKRENRGYHHPFILIGGIVPSANPEPFAPFADAILIGEAEEWLSEVLTILEENWEEDRETLFKRLAEVEGIYLPQLYRPRFDDFGRYGGMEPMVDWVRFPIRRISWSGFKDSGARSCVVSKSSHFSDMELVEVSRGCPNLCNFCLAAHLNRPVRFVKKEVLLNLISASGERIGLVGTSIWPPDYIVEVVDHALSLGKRLSFSSLRLDAPLKLFEAMVKGSTLSATLGVEAASEDRRRVAGKLFSNPFLEKRIVDLAEMGFDSLKLYFMVGLPPLDPLGEAEEIVSLVRRLIHLIRAKRLKTKLSVSVSPFVPKPHTPFQRETMAEKEDLTQAIKKIEKGLKPEKKVSFTYELPKWSLVQALVSRGDRLVGEVIYRIVRGESLRQAMAKSNCNLHHYLHRKREANEPLPWEVVAVD